jgi:hypothetical protein
MGRGRAKAKQTKVARELKYGTVNTDLSALQAELSASRQHDLEAMPPSTVIDNDEDEDGDVYEDDPYAKYYDENDEEDDDE